MENELPKGWVYTKLGVIAEWGSGGTPNRSESKYYNGTIPWIKTGDLNDSIILEASEFITELGLKKSSAKLFPKGSIIVAMYGATIGKTARLGIDATTNQACAVAKASSIVIPEFLHYFLKAEKQEFIEKGKGGAQPNISQTVIKDHPFPLPPLPEQQRIVAKLDSLFEQLDRMKTSMERIPQLLKDFRQKVLTQAVTGKLTEEWREGRELDSSTLISNIRGCHVLAGGHKKGNAANPDIEKHSNSFDNIPESWIKLDLREICHPEKPITYGILMPGEEVENGRPYLKVMSYPNDRIDFDKIRHTSVEIEESYKRARLSEGDIVLSIRGTVGRVIIIPPSLDGANITQDSARISLQTGISNSFIAMVLRSQIIQDIMISVTKGVAVRGINIGDVRFLKIPIPTFEEQQEIVRRVESLFAKADRIEASYQRLKVKLEQLPQALLPKAFRGELVEQLPTDGDARDLLEQIKKAKAGLEKGGKSKRLGKEEPLRMVAEDGVRYGKK